jgi:hypothetical protein
MEGFVVTTAITPRVRSVLICDDVIASDLEPNVVTLEGVRQQLSATSFPVAVELHAFMVLSCPRQGSFDGTVRVIDPGTEKTLRYTKFTAVFDDEEVIPIEADLGVCRFPQPGSYTFEVWLTPPGGAPDVLKAEFPFKVHQIED